RSLQLVFNLIMIMKPEWFGIKDPTLAPRLSFLITGIWWIGFAGFTFYYLPEKSGIASSDDHVSAEGQVRRGGLYKGFKELGNVLKQLKNLGRLKMFLLSFFFYNMGVQTVMYVASLFGAKEI